MVVFHSKAYKYEALVTQTTNLHIFHEWKRGIYPANTSALRCMCPNVHIPMIMCPHSSWIPRTKMDVSSSMSSLTQSQCETIFVIRCTLFGSTAQKGFVIILNCHFYLTLFYHTWKSFLFRREGKWQNRRNKHSFSITNYLYIKVITSNTCFKWYCAHWQWIIRL